MWVFDATPLIYLATVDRVGYVRQLRGRRVIPARVYDEVVTRGLEEGYPDARRLERAVENSEFEVQTVEETALTDRLQQNPTLSDADIAVLTCAATKDGTAVMDEAAGRSAAAVEGIETRATAYLVCSLAKQGKIETAAARETVDAMVDAGWYCAPDLYAKIVRTLESL
ncbi:DUF3368 domain-containing protein [Natronobiforma cellulositropha]|uniref:DUF3368 domain-containing protein n=1 Tax=Natronobiforma cellulositropha TaxID=1679076 RepID=UPI0021D5EB30|nr:DUF3368 domain-containing protein [Natronobiforma cellulositropha]